MKMDLVNKQRNKVTQLTLDLRLAEAELRGMLLAVDEKKNTKETTVNKTGRVLLTNTWQEVLLYIHTKLKKETFKKSDVDYVITKQRKKITDTNKRLPQFVDAGWLAYNDTIKTWSFTNKWYNRFES